MAIKRDDDPFCYVLLCEKNDITPRRYPQLDVLARDGTMYRLKGDELPDGMIFHSGKSRRGGNLGTIMLNPEKASRLPQFVYDTRPWPSCRDLVNFAIGFSAIAALNFILSLLGLF